jgi:hypothetical protein
VAQWLEPADHVRLVAGSSHAKPATAEKHQVGLAALSRIQSRRLDSLRRQFWTDLVKTGRTSSLYHHPTACIDGQNASAGWQVRSVILLEIDLPFDRRLLGSISGFGGHDKLLITTEVGDDLAAACRDEFRSAIAR